MVDSNPFIRKTWQKSQSFPYTVKKNVFNNNIKKINTFSGVFSLLILLLTIYHHFAVKQMVKEKNLM